MIVFLFDRFTQSSSRIQTRSNKLEKHTRDWCSFIRVRWLKSAWSINDSVNVIVYKYTWHADIYMGWWLNLLLFFFFKHSLMVHKWCYTAKHCQCEFLYVTYIHVQFVWEHIPLGHALAGPKIIFFPKYFIWVRVNANKQCNLMWLAMFQIFSSNLLSFIWQNDLWNGVPGMEWMIGEFVLRPKNVYVTAFKFILFMFLFH